MENETMLMIGYLLLALAAGSALTALLGEWIGKSQAARPATAVGTVSVPLSAGPESDAYLRFARIGAFAAPLLAIAGLVVALFHLGRMERLVNMLFQVNSWLTRESWAAGLFIACAVLYALTWQFKWGGALRQVFGVLTGAFGLVMVLSMSMVYVVVRTIPAWNTPLLLLVFLSSALALGETLVAALASLRRTAQPAGSLTMLAKTSALLIGLAALAYGLYLVYLVTALPMQRVPSSLFGAYQGWLWLRVIIGLVVPFVAAIAAWRSAGTNPRLATIALWAAFLCLLGGELIARTLHFLTATHLPVL